VILPVAGLHKTPTKLNIRHHLVVPPAETSEVGDIMGATFGAWEEIWSPPADTDLCNMCSRVCIRTGPLPVESLHVGELE